MIKKTILSLLKYLVLPFALLYGLVVWIRNKMYDWKLISSIKFSLPVICVGNITVGGTGKSPHIEYLIELLSGQYQLATLSRGYRRYTRGFKIADVSTNARDIGDEPYQFMAKYPQITVCVAEERMTAIPFLLQNRPGIQIILLDDAFQHRTVRAGLNILLSDFDRLYTRDHVMPFGLLREGRGGAQRAEIIIVTKCPPDLSTGERDRLGNEIAPQPNQTLYFTTIHYKHIYPLTTVHQAFNNETKILLVTGIANALPLLQHLKNNFAEVFQLEYKDHHYFTFDDIDEINQAFQHIATDNKIIITTEKDASRLMLLKDKIFEYRLPFYAQAIHVDFLFDEGEKFNRQITSYVEEIIPPQIDQAINEG